MHEKLHHGEHRNGTSIDRPGFTLVELLVVIAIIGILVALLLPAIQAAREAARRNQCKNHVKQLALGCLLHEDTQKFLPSGGWRDAYPPDPNRGYGIRQPGSWAYSILSYIEEQALRDLGKGQTFTGTGAPAAFSDPSLKLHQSLVTIFNCPTRRATLLRTWVSSAGSGPSWLVNVPVLKGDYAANAGDSQQTAGNGFSVQMWPPGGMTYTQIDADQKWNDTSCTPIVSRSGTAPGPYCQSGAVGHHSEIKISQISDGASNTYLIGEKYLFPPYYETSVAAGGGYGDNQSVFAGYEWDNTRRAYQPLVDGNNNTNDTQPSQDTPGLDNNKSLYAFGSAHAGGLNMAMCDGSVQFVSYDIDPTTHRYLAVRNDGETASLP